MKTHSQKLYLALALAGSCLARPATQASAQGIQPIYYFTGGPAGPSGLVQGPDGSFYGTSSAGGSSGDGTVFQVTTNGVMNMLASFSYTNGANPATLALGTDGNFYGTTSEGGSSGNGTVFRVTTNGVLTTLANFDLTNGSSPKGALALGPDGNFYGTTYNGGISDNGNGSSGGNGTVFRVTTNGVLTTLANFNLTNGSLPNGALALGPDGNFYGTTYEGASNATNYGVIGEGTIFRVTTNGVLTTLASFGETNGAYPTAGLTLGSDGNFYGTTENGGTTNYGTVFRVTTSGELTMLASFAATNGASPVAALTLGSDGNFYGTTEGGGTNGYGTIFRVTTSGELTTLFSFNDTNGADPTASLALGLDGGFYDTAQEANNSTAVFRITTNGVLTMMASFANTNGANPNAPLTLGPDGSFYSSTEAGGSSFNWGTVFQITTNGVQTTLASFNDTNGADPSAPLTLGLDGGFYGTTYQGGSGSTGTVFRVTTGGILTTLYSFTGGSDGASPYAGLTLGPDGSFYGTTLQGGSGGNNGTIFRVTTNGALTTLYSFTGGSDGASPYAGLTLGPDSNLYGTTESGGATGYGTVFRVTTNGALTTLLNFAVTNGGQPRAALTLGPDGNFYGTTRIGGSNNGWGTVFRVATNGALTSLHSFTAARIGPHGNVFTNSDGARPYAALALGPDGSLYGTTEEGGSNGYGTVFRVTTNGVLTTLATFAGTNAANINGGNPSTPLTLGADGNFYGTTSSTFDNLGYPKAGGMIFRLNLPPSIITQPSNLVATVGHSATFSVTLFGTAPISYQWLSNGVTVSGATSSTFTISSATLATAGNYQVIITNAWGSVTSSVATLAFSPSITIQPANEIVPIAGNASFTASATGSLPLFYQWYLNGAQVPGATGTAIAFGPVFTNQAGNYQLIVTNSFGSATSSVAALTVLLEPNSYGISSTPGGSATVYLAGAPGSTNYLYATTNLALSFSEWQLVNVGIAGTNGLFQFVDSQTTGVPTKFYRLSSQPIAPPIVISSISPIAPQQTQTITISGHGFGTQNPYNGNSDYISVQDVTGDWEAGYAPDGNLITLNVTSWTDNQIVISGFTGDYGTGAPYNWFLQQGDNLTIAIWNAQSSIGPATYSITVNSNLPAQTCTFDNSNSVTFIPTSSFNYNPTLPNLRYVYGSSNSSAAFQWSSQDADGNPNSGSAEASLTINENLDTNAALAAFTIDLAGGNGLSASDLSFDLMIAPGSATDQYGGYGDLGILTVTGGWGTFNHVWDGPTPETNYEFGASFGIPYTVGTWYHFDIPLTGSAATNINAIAIQDYDGGQKIINGTINLFIDNLRLTPTP